MRQAVLDDADTVAAVARTSRQHFLPYLPELHALDGDKKFYCNVVFSECDVWVYEHNREIVGFCAFREGWIDQLYLLPEYAGQSLGEALVAKAQSSHPFLQLMVFLRNARAIRFYECNGFQLVKVTDGSGCKEQLPDALYELRL